MRVWILQFFPEFGEKEKNVARVENLLHKAEADLIVLPELFTTGYLFLSREELESRAEPIPGPTTERLTALAEGDGFSIVAGIAEVALGRCYNSAVLVLPDGSFKTY